MDAAHCGSAAPPPTDVAELETATATANASIAAAAAAAAPPPPPSKKKKTKLSAGSAPLPSSEACTSAGVTGAVGGTPAFAAGDGSAAALSGGANALATMNLINMVSPELSHPSF